MNKRQVFIMSVLVVSMNFTIYSSDQPNYSSHQQDDQNSWPTWQGLVSWVCSQTQNQNQTEQVEDFQMSYQRMTDFPVGNSDRTTVEKVVDADGKAQWISQPSRNIRVDATLRDPKKDQKKNNFR